ncbi:S8 family serine peptidase [Dactylosporangium sp. CA-092794]|uniref:S8 family serine peptidase n=1 Tax=Dactylosporangium sp. CA-092794 TaxID=3239929 RepID=UPI003D92CB90
MRPFGRTTTVRLAAIGVAATALIAAFATPALAGPGGSSGRSADSLLHRPLAFDAAPGKFRAAAAGAVANSYIVVLKDTKATPTDVTDSADRLTRAHRGKVGKVYSKALRGFTATLTEADAKQLAADPGVAYVEQNRYVTAAETQNTVTTSANGLNLWALDRLDQPFLPLNHRYSYPVNTTNVNVYVLDTGINAGAADLQGNPGLKHGWSATFPADPSCAPNTDGHDDNGHGTFVAAEIAGTTYGVAKQAPLESVKVLDCNGTGTDAEVIEGIEHVTATAVKPAVANMSLGGSVSTAIDDAVKASIASGITYVVAAGNEGVDACTVSPARVPQAITVGATDHTDFRASFSNYGTCLDIFAPGVDVQGSYQGGYAYASGTSMAAPLAAGDAVLLLHAHPTWTPAQVQDAIVRVGITGTVHNAGAGSTSKLLRAGEPTPPNTFGLRSHANNLIVTADGGGARPLIANRYNVGGWENLTVVDAGDGSHVALRSSSNNLYVTADNAGASPLIASRTTIGAWEKFTLIRNADGSVSLQAAINGKYVTADNGGSSALIANRATIGPWEEFDLTGQAAAIFLISLANGEIVTADNGGNSPLIANRDDIGAWEQFDIVDAGGGYAAIVAHANGKFVTADNGGASPLIANRTSVGPWEKFKLVNNPDLTLSFLANANNRYVTADNAGASPLIANRTVIGGDWEEFVYATTDELNP